MISKSRFYLTIVLMTLNVACYGIDEEQRAIDYLNTLEIEDLVNVEVVLDEVFDVFDGLIKAKKISVATGTEQSTARAPAVTTVITAQDIEATGATDLDEVLRAVPGLHVSKSVYIYDPIYTIRGMRSESNPEVLMLINGIPITFIYHGNRGYWAGMPINMIARVEIIRGPGSAVYGADAYSGVINIITKTKEEIKGTEVGTRAGSFKTYEGWALHGRNWNGFEIAAGLEYRTTDGQKGIVQEDAQTQFDKLFNTHASLAPGTLNTGIEDSIDVRLDIKKGKWQARAGYQGRNNIGTGPGIAQALDPVGYFDSERISADLTYHNPTLTPHWDITTQISYFDIGYKSNLMLFPSGAMGGLFPNGMIGNPGLADRRFNIDTFAFYSGFKKHLIRVGTGYSHNNQYKVTHTSNFGIDPATGEPLPPGSPVISMTDTPYAYNKKVKRNSQYLSLQDIWKLTENWELTAGIRYDDYSDFGSTTNPRLALVWQPYSNFTSKLLYGRAFRAPSFNELYNANNPVLQGNPNLKPEIINTWELAFDYRINRDLHLATNLFYYKATDRILYIAVPDADVIVAQNIGILEGQGLELEARWKMTSKSSLLANYSYARTLNKTADQDAGGYPRRSAYLRTDWLLVPNWYLDVQANWVADRQRVFGDSRPPVADYTTVDLTLRYKDIQRGRTNIAFSIRNLFDSDAREPSP